MIYFDHQIMLDQCKVAMCYDVSIGQVSLVVQINNNLIKNPVNQLSLISMSGNKNDQCSTSLIFLC